MTAWRPAVGRWLAVVTFVVAFVFTYGPDAVQMDVVPALLVSTFSAGAVWLSGVRPASALALVVLATAALVATRSTFDALPLVIVLVGFQAVLASTFDPRLLAGVVLATLTANELWTRHVLGRPYAETSIVYPALMAALTVGLGLQSRRIRVQSEELVALRDAERRRAVTDERQRIARDVHDIAAHHLSALVVHNKLARRVGTSDALGEAAEFSARTAAVALDSLRQVVGVLSADERSPFEPQPTLSAIDDVVQRLEAAGLRVDRSVGQLPSVPGATEVAVVRIVQEALTNVLRHRGPGQAWMCIDGHGAVIDVVVEDDGPSAWDDQMAEPAWHRPGSHGLVGMRERAAACGGSLHVSRSPRGGWRIAAALPVASS